MGKKNPEEPEKITEEQKEELEKKNLPPFRERESKKSPEIPDQKEKKADSLDGDDETTEPDLIEICRDFADIPFQIWSIRNPNVPPLDEKEKDLISKHLLKLAVKYKVKKFMKDELILIAAVGYSVMKRARIKKDVDDNSRQEREGKDEPGQADHPG